MKEKTTSNLDIWNKYADIDPKFTKKITGKPYQGTSPSPQYIIKCLTDMFGPVGKGFGWTVEREEFQPLGEEILHWCRIRFWWTDGDTIASFESYGQTKALMKTKSGLMSDEDAPKKSLTDAIVKAASQIGVAANIFLGRWDDQKYVAEVNADYRATEVKSSPRPEHAAAVSASINAIGREKDRESLAAFWADLCRTSRAVAEDKAVIAAKDKRKAELSAKDTDLGSDEIPY